jgi:hypothetical protein
LDCIFFEKTKQKEIDKQSKGYIMIVILDKG